MNHLIYILTVKYVLMFLAEKVQGYVDDVNFDPNTTGKLSNTIH